MHGRRWRTAVVLAIVCLAIATTWPANPPGAAAGIPYEGVSSIRTADAALASRPGAAERQMWAVPTLPPRASISAPSELSPLIAWVELPAGTAGPPRRERPSPPLSPPLQELTVAVTGDVLVHQPVMEAARTPDGPFDFVPLLRALEGPIGRADLALCHLEVPLSRDHRGLSSYPTFNAPPEVAEALAEVGYDGCSVASNHSFDQGVDGIVATLDVLDDVGLGHAGMARTRRESRRIRTYDVDGVEVAHLSYTYGLNGFVLPQDRRWMVDTISVPKIRREAARARRAGADVVLVSMHWGVEYVSEPTLEQRELARALLGETEIDALIGHHAHVVQPIERVEGKVVIFGLGNVLSNQSAACCAAATQDGVIVELTLRGPRDGRFDVERVVYHPTMVQHPQRRVVLVDRMLRRTDDPHLRRKLRASRQRTEQVIGDVAQPAAD